MLTEHFTFILFRRPIMASTRMKPLYDRSRRPSLVLSTQFSSHEINRAFFFSFNSYLKLLCFGLRSVVVNQKLRLLLLAAFLSSFKLLLMFLCSSRHELTKVKSETTFVRSQFRVTVVRGRLTYLASYEEKSS